MEKISAVAPSSGTSSDLPVLEAHQLRSMWPSALEHHQQRHWAPQLFVAGPPLLGSPQWSTYRCHPHRLQNGLKQNQPTKSSVNLLDFQLLVTPCTSPLPGRICCSTNWGRCKGSWPCLYLSLSCLWKAPPHSLLFHLLQPSTSSSSLLIQQIKGLSIECLEGCKVYAILHHSCLQVWETVQANMVP